MSLDVFGFISPDFTSTPAGGVEIGCPGDGGYTGPGNKWEPGTTEWEAAPTANITGAPGKTIEFLQGAGHTVRASDVRVVHFNDGTMIWPDDDGNFSHLLRFSDGQAVREWRVMEADNRPWRNFCRVVVHRYRGSK